MLRRVSCFAIALCTAAMAHAEPGLLEAALDEAEAEVVEGDALGFERGVRAVLDGVAQAPEPVAPPVAARVHAVLALWHWAHREDDAARASLRSVRVLTPSLVLDPHLFPPGGALHLAWEAASSTPGPTAPARLPARRGVWFDGVATRERPLDRPALVQIAGRDGRPDVGAVLLPEARLPSPAWVGRTRRDLAISAGVLGGAAAGFYGGAWGAWSAFQQHPADDIGGLRERQVAANALTGSAIAAATAAVGTAIAAAVLR